MNAQTRWILRGVAGTLICGCHSAVPDSKLSNHAPWPPEAAAVDRSLTLDPLARQARNGEIIEATLFNYHFKDNYKQTLNEDGSPKSRETVPVATSNLTPAGSQLIQRLARRYDAGCEFRLFVQLANDVPLNPKDPATVSRRSELEKKRVEEVTGLAQMLRPDLLVRVELLDPDSVGMSGREATLGVLQHISNTNGLLRPDSYDPKSGESKVAEPPKIEAAAAAANAPGALNPN